MTAKSEVASETETLEEEDMATTQTTPNIDLLVPSTTRQAS